MLRSSRINEVDQQLREINKTAETKFSLWLHYGSSPDEPTSLVVTAQGSEKLIVRSVNADHELCKAVFDVAVEVMGLDHSTTAARVSRRSPSASASS